MYSWPRCISCGRLLYSPRTLKLLYNDATCCSDRCRLLWENDLNWRAQIREVDHKVVIPPFPFFRHVHDRVED